MKMTVNNKAKILITLFMIGLMGMLIVNTIVFTHIHQLDDGTIVEHAHPYNKANDSAPLKTHHHSNAELFFFQNSNILFLVAFMSLGMVFSVKKKKNSFDFILEHSLTYINLHKERAPPVS
ncbi:MAG: hypothetical protein PHN55_15755 [Dysgonamonadaceae bacterium]|nr:hypothetical protein [Dysgonamonadaceae bacterium]